MKRISKDLMRVFNDNWYTIVDVWHPLTPRWMAFHTQWKSCCLVSISRILVHFVLPLRLTLHYIRCKIWFQNITQKNIIQNITFPHTIFDAKEFISKSFFAIDMLLNNDLEISTIKTIKKSKVDSQKHTCFQRCIMIRCKSAYPLSWFTIIAQF